jgi:uncharacterized protein YjbI with pentapeptide repeats/uncharacterized RDD family membrane protein YckC
LAWGLEVTILGASIAVPFYLGGQLNEQVAAPSAEITAPLQVAQGTMAQMLGLSPRSLPDRVTPLTNFLWTTALGLPVILAVAHGYSISRYGRSWPKQWLGVQVLALNGEMPGLRRTLLREGVGKWGGPLLVAYGVWKFSGAFPLIGVLGGLGVLALMGESLTGLGNRPRRSWHDWLAGTCVVDQDTGAIIRLTSLWDTAANRQGDRPGWGAWGDRQGGLTSVVLNPTAGDAGKTRLDPSTLGLGLSLLLLLGGLIGVGSHFLLQAQSPNQAGEELLYTNLVSTLTNPELDAAARRAAVLALGNLPDDRVTPLLVDLIAQTEDPLWLDALQQALVARGSEAFAPLRRLNQSLAADIAMQGDPAFQRILKIRLQTVNRILTKLIVLEGSDRPHPLDLSRLHVGYLPEANGVFRLVLKHQDLAGIQWSGSVMTQAQLQGAKFFHPGPDAHADTYDDLTADLSGADLTDANLTGADLTLARLVNTGLLRTKLNRANLTLADLSGANLEQASLIQATLAQAQLAEARLSNADLTAAQLPDVNLEAARLSEVHGAGVQMPGANLQGVSAKSANLADSDLSHANLSHADLSEARLQGATLRNADLTNANLRDTDLRGIWLQGAILEGIDLAGAILAEPAGVDSEGFVESVPELPTGDQLAGVDFTRARNLDPDQLTFICNQGGIHPACDLPVQDLPIPE